jgi:hypothetical protein
MANQYKDFIAMSGIEFKDTNITVLPTENETNDTLPIPEQSNKLITNVEFSEVPLSNDNTLENITTPEENITTPEENIITEQKNFNEMGENDDDSGIILSVLHTIDDIVFFGRSYIENNLFNISDNEDFSIIFPNIYIGNYSTSTNKQLLKDLGITNIITVLPPSFTPLFPDDFKYLHIPAYDDNYQDISQHFDITNEYIHDVLSNNGRLYLHCMAGRSRSITLFMAFLINVMKGCYKYSEMALINNDDKINKLEYRQLIKSIKPNKITYIDSNNLNNRNRNGNGNGNGNGNNSNSNDNSENNDIERINKVEQETPKLSRKEENFILYKKQNMVNDLDNLCSRYNILKKTIIVFNDDTSESLINEMTAKFTNTIMAEILNYICKYRPIAEPNNNFINQLNKIII